MAETPTPKSIAIIGASISGLTLACSIIHHFRSMPSSPAPPRLAVFDSRSSANLPTGAIMLCPNSLRILDALGVYDDICKDAFIGSTISYLDASLRTTDRYWFGSTDRWGYPSVRLHRWVLISKLRALAVAMGVHIEYGCKFESVGEDADGGLVVRFEGGRRERTNMLVGADGIHSSVRASAFPRAQPPKYTGILSVSGFVTRSALRLPKDVDLELPAIVSGTGANTAFLMINQSHDGEEIMIGVNRIYPQELGKKGYAELQADIRKLKEMFYGKQGDGWPDVVQSAIENFQDETAYLWPFYQLPRLDSWVDTTGSVFLVGDAAHAMPPPAGQGANQAVEDCWTLALVLARLSTEENISTSNALKVWEMARMKRVDRVSELNGVLINARLPSEQRKQLNGKKEVKSEELQLDWLYAALPEDEILKWFDRSREARCANAVLSS